MSDDNTLNDYTMYYIDNLMYNYYQWCKFNQGFPKGLARSSSWCSVNISDDAALVIDKCLLKLTKEDRKIIKDYYLNTGKYDITPYVIHLILNFEQNLKDANIC